MAFAWALDWGSGFTGLDWGKGFTGFDCGSGFTPTSALFFFLLLRFFFASSPFWNPSSDSMSDLCSAASSSALRPVVDCGPLCRPDGGAFGAAAGDGDLAGAGAAGAAEVGLEAGVRATPPVGDAVGVGPAARFGTDFEGDAVPHAEALAAAAAAFAAQTEGPARWFSISWSCNARRASSSICRKASASSSSSAGPASSAGSSSSSCSCSASSTSSGSACRGGDTGAATGAGGAGGSTGAGTVGVAADSAVSRKACAFSGASLGGGAAGVEAR
mmetsp:Transcript_17794/g.39195  ORF Transcript_17794/g.39195 Transcript_17794/m.39195 type:complete len:273 (+) Transcript_17794:542-1360(+)